MFTLKHELETFFIIILASIVFVFINANNNHKSNFNNSVASVVYNIVQATPIPTLVPSPTLIPTPIVQVPQTTTWTSSDGSKILTMKTVYNSNLTKTYSFFISSSINSNNFQSIYSQVASASSIMSIPFNAFSPDNKYIYLQDSENDGIHYLVFSTLGKTFSNGESFLDVTNDFRKYTSNYLLHNVTGWASNTLLTLETTVNGISSGTSFWYDVSNQSFTPLATRF